MPDHYQDVVRTVAFRGAVEMALAEDRGLFRPLAQQGSETGKRIEITDRFSRLQMQQIQERHGKTNLSFPTVERRWIAKQKRSGVAVPIDADDKTSTTVDVRSPIVMGTADAARQYHDDQWLLGFYGPAIVGEEGTSTVNFKGANVIAADHGETPTNHVGLTFAKVNQLQFLRKRRFARQSKADRLHVAITAFEARDLLAMDKFTNGDYRNTKPLENGEITEWMGIKWVPAEIDDATQYPNAAALAVNGSGHRRLPCWLPSGMYYNTWTEFEGHTDTVPMMNHDELIAGYSNGRAARIHEDKCFIIECAGS
jgi:hypothetical protein